MKREVARLLRPQGADVVSSGVRYRIWAPEKQRIEVIVQPADGGAERTLSLEPEPDGYHCGSDPAGRAGDRYRYVVDGAGPFPDPASRWQPDGVHGASQVIDPDSYAWQDAAWKCPPLRDLVLYELHIGTFTPQGTFRAAIEKLPFLRDLGVKALQLMPLADFPGERGWGYDGVSLFAPARCYGTPDDLRALVDAAHAQGIAVVLDVVFNHFGPDGNYVGCYSRFYYNEAHQTPWGAALNFDGPQKQEVRAFYIANAVYWIDEFHFDGLRLDATHTMVDDSPHHVLELITGAVHDRGAFVIAEDERNLARIIEPEGFDFDAVYADDFCHSVQVALGDQSYRKDFDGTPAELANELRHGWHYRGQHSKLLDGPRGTACAHLPPSKFLLCISNHDQAGNRAFGERLHQLATPEAYRAASGLLLLSPGTPMLFMGQEWGASTPFLFFADHHDELGKLVSEGRHREFAHFPEFADSGVAHSIPDPQNAATFTRSKLDWDELNDPSHAALLLLHRECLRLRAADAAFRPLRRVDWEVGGQGAVTIRFKGLRFQWLVVANLSRSPVTTMLPDAPWRAVLSSNETRFGGDGVSCFDPKAGNIAFTRPEFLVLQSPP
ncbi:MAG: malto-oligosyltrehalose trehalohydrolase [Prosthecobacter sp.]|jgi:maltooligosyltrehalose trehalohydrolase|uniref:malto-oligosyltrehalose trehalohydrolase n=1 Tax=Prosthecobacter sp. TaxID=1965333 RepID=UPI001A04A7A7|nr:malto-oligosyltrehalose trehalohydrolase [Prosthecobacter sp.]MBE2284600.1 malto-oligosyltrehalose trehalohydrolase [Prosthecobacter sp.]